MKLIFQLLKTFYLSYLHPKATKSVSKRDGGGSRPLLENVHLVAAFSYEWLPIPSEPLFKETVPQQATVTVNIALQWQWWSLLLSPQQWVPHSIMAISCLDCQVFFLFFFMLNQWYCPYVVLCHIPHNPILLQVAFCFISLVKTWSDNLAPMHPSSFHSDGIFDFFLLFFLACMVAGCMIKYSLQKYSLVGRVNVNLRQVFKLICVIMDSNMWLFMFFSECFVSMWWQIRVNFAYFFAPSVTSIRRGVELLPFTHPEIWTIMQEFSNFNSIQTKVK